jgi:hypothetical protein
MEFLFPYKFIVILKKYEYDDGEEVVKTTRYDRVSGKSIDRLTKRFDSYLWEFDVW